MPLFTYKNHKKVISGFVSEVTIRSTFNIANDKCIFIQCFNTEFEEFIDCDWEDVTNSAYKKFLICEDTEHRPISQNNNTTNIQASTSQEIPVVQSANQTESVSISRASTIELDQNDIIIVDCATTGEPQLERQMAFCGSPTQQQPSKSGINNNYDVLPTSYKLPYINKDSKLGKALASKEILKTNSKLKSEFLTKIYESFTSKGIYYLGTQTEGVACAILNEYPHLGNGLDQQTAKNIWKYSLYHKFYNGKARDDAEVETVKLAKKAKLEKKAILKEKPLNSSACFNIPNYCPVRNEEDEDDASIESHRVWMQSEYDKSPRNESSITLRMARTFKDRRHLLFEKNQDGSLKCSGDVLEIYPCLKLESHALEEVNLLFGKEFDNLFNLIPKFAIVIEDKFMESKCKNKAYMLNLFSSSNVQERETIQCFKLIGYLAILLFEDPREVIGHNIINSGSPTLVIEDNSSVSLYVDGKAFISNISAISATFLWVAAFIFFNIEVPVKVKRLYEFLQHVYFNIPEKPKVTQLSSVLYALWLKLED